jgi:hypothetical protein
LGILPVSNSFSCAIGGKELTGSYGNIGPFYECSYDIPTPPSEDVEMSARGTMEKAVPEILLTAAQKVADRATQYSGKTVKVEKIRVLGWMVAGSRKVCPHTLFYFCLFLPVPSFFVHLVSFGVLTFSLPRDNHRTKALCMPRNTPWL